MAEPDQEKIHRVTTDDGHFYRFTESDANCISLDTPESLTRNDYRLMRFFLNCHPDFVYFFDRDHRFIYANAALVELWGLELADVEGKNFEELGYPPDLVALHETQLDLAFAGKTIRGENAYVAESGKEGYYEYIFVPVPDENGRINSVAGITRDITRRRQLEEEREFMLTAMAHDLRTPLGVLKMGAEVMADGTDDEGLRSLADRMLRSASRAEQMLRSLLDSTRLRAGKDITLEIREVDLAEVIADAIDQLRVIHSGTIELSVEHARDCCVGHWDEEAIRRIVENLVSNAVKYGASERPITVTLACSREAARLSVHNWGTTIDARNKDRLFRLFSRDETAGSGWAGWGVGLTVVAALVEAHDGAVELESSPEHGTRFSVVLPDQQPA